MRDLPANVYSVKAVRHLDRCAIDREGIAGYTLMSRAGAFCYRRATEDWPDMRACVVVCGAGNNAGDGYVVARLALADGRLHSVVTLVDPDTLQGDARHAYEEFVAAGGQVSHFNGHLPTEADLLIDALLGTGLARELDGKFAAAVDGMNTHAAPVVAVDIPSGLHGDSGRVMGTAVMAALTVSFVGLKSGLFLGAGRKHCGHIAFYDLGVPASCYDMIRPLMVRTRDSDTAAALPPRDICAHKGDFGHVVIVGGGKGMPGAVRMAGEAALVAGAGRVSIATHPAHAALAAATRPELMCHGIESRDELQDLLAKADVVAIGPGLGHSDWARSMLSVAVGSALPSVWDADALNLLAEAPQQAAQRIITPHPGEAARLLDTGIDEVQSDRLASVARLQERYAGVAVLKGAGTIIHDGRAVRFCDGGNPGMATAGMGDVLTGIIAALLGQGLPLADAAATGVHVHARAGDMAAGDRPRGLMASDLLAAVRDAVNP